MLFKKCCWFLFLNLNPRTEEYCLLKYFGKIKQKTSANSRSRHFWHKKNNKRQINKTFRSFVEIANFNKTVSRSYLKAEYSVINNFKTKLPREFILTSRISTLCNGRYMQVIKSLGHHLNGR